jgi:hypothetical protein
VFHPAALPHPSAPEACAAALIADFSFSFLPTPYILKLDGGVYAVLLLLMSRLPMVWKTFTMESSMLSTRRSPPRRRHYNTGANMGHFKVPLIFKKVPLNIF